MSSPSKHYFYGGSLQLGNADGSVSPLVAETFTVNPRIAVGRLAGSKTDWPTSPTRSRRTHAASSSLR